MFQNFDLTRSDGGIKGYIWECDNPKKVMCIIHGIGEHAGRYDRMAKYLTEAGIAVISMDLRGHGLSQGLRGDCAPRIDVLKDVTAMLDEARERYPDLPIVLYGHSMGGNICLDYRCRGEKNDLPIKYIVSAPWVRLIRSVPKPLYVTLKGISKLAPKLRMSSGCKAEDLGNIAITASYTTDPLVHTSVTLRCAVDGFEIGEAIFRGDNEDNHKADGKPFLLMHGDADKICNVEGSREVAKRYADKTWFRYIEWPGYYHEIHNGGPDATGEEVIEAIRDFALEE